MAKTLSRLISPQRAKTNAKHAQNAAYNQAQIAAQSGQPIAPPAQAAQPFNRRQQTNLQHQQNARYNQDVMAGNVPPPAPVTQNSDYAGSAPAPAIDQNQSVQLGSAGVPLGQADAMPRTGGGLVTNMGQQAGSAASQPTGQAFGQSMNIGQPRPMPSANRGGQYRVSPGIYRSRPAPMRNAIPRPTFGGGLLNTLEYKFPSGTNMGSLAEKATGMYGAGQQKKTWMR